MDWFITTIGIIIFFIILLILFYVYYWVRDLIYHHIHPDKKRLKKRLLKSYLVSKYGKEGKNIYKEFKNELWEKHRIR